MPIREFFAPEVLDYTQLLPHSCITIDGDDHSGKTPLALKVANAVGAKVVSLDEYLLKDGRPYWEQIQYESLRNALSAYLTKLVIEGVCALKVLAKLGVRHDYHVFTKRVMFGKWEYGEYLDERLRLPKSKMAKDIVQYYREFKPFEACNQTQTLYIDAVEL